MYWLYITFDADDPFYDDEATLSGLRGDVQKLVVDVLARKHITVRFVFLRFENHVQKPGPVFNFMMGAAFRDGADYLYRINDDTEFVNAWAGDAIMALRAHSPPKSGVAGPLCKQGNQKILTHDFVHRTHMLIFRYRPSCHKNRQQKSR